MATIQSLAPEILIDIFELAHDPHKPSTMKSASLVCRAWRDPAQRALFFDVVVPMIETKNARVTRALFGRWDTDSSVGVLPSPRRVELWAPPTDVGILESVGRSLQYIRGVKSLTITGETMLSSFLLPSGVLFGGLETLDLQNNLWMRINHPVRLLNWPHNLRALRISLQGMVLLLEDHHLPGAALVSLTLEIDTTERVRRILSSNFIPPSVRDLKIILSVPMDFSYLTPFFATVQYLHNVAFDFKLNLYNYTVYGSLSYLFRALTEALLASVKRLGFERVHAIYDPSAMHVALTKNPLLEIQELVSSDSLTNLNRIDFPKYKRKDLEEGCAAVDLLAECERRSIRVVCWEDLL